MDPTLRDELAASEDRHWWFEGRRAIVRSVLETLRLESSSALLEAGCGNGANLSMLAEFGATCGFEPDPVDCRRAAARGCAIVSPGRLPDGIPFDDRRFDVVLALDVIEHLDDDVTALSALRSRIAAGGRLVVTVPAYPWLWSAHDVRNGHRRRYTRSTLLGALSQAGFVVERVTHFNTLLFPLVALVRVAGRLVSADSAGTSTPPGALNPLLRGIFASERRVVKSRSLPFGVSLLALAHPAR